MTPPLIPGDDRNVVSIFDYTRDQVESVRRELTAKIDHEARNRKQSAEMVTSTFNALSDKGWVKLTLDSITQDISEMKAQQKVDREESKRAQTRILTVTSGVLISLLTLLLTIIFGILIK